MIKKSNAFLLISYPYKSTSLISHFLTDDAIVQALSYGVKKESKNFGSDLNSVSKLSIVYYQNNSKNLNTLKECSIIKNYSNIERNDYCLFTLYYVREVLLNIAKDYDYRLFLIMEKMLDALSENIEINKDNENKVRENINILIRAFEIKTLHIAGISPQLSSCMYCNNNNSDNYIFSLEDSSIVCNNCLNNILESSITYKLSKEDIEFLKIIKHKSFSDILKIDINKYKKNINAISSEILTKLLYNHIGHVLKSRAMLEDMLF